MLLCFWWREAGRHGFLRRDLQSVPVCLLEGEKKKPLGHWHPCKTGGHPGVLRNEVSMWRWVSPTKLNVSCKWAFLIPDRRPQAPPHRPQVELLAVYMLKYAHSKAMTGKLIERHYGFMESAKPLPFPSCLMCSCHYVYGHRPLMGDLM